MSNFWTAIKIIFKIAIIALIVFALLQVYYFVKNYFNPPIIYLNQSISVEYSLNDTYDSIDYSYNELISTAYSDENCLEDILIKLIFFDEAGEMDVGQYFISLNNGLNWAVISDINQYVYFKTTSNIYRIPFKDFSKSNLITIWNNTQIETDLHSAGTYEINKNIILTSNNIEKKSDNNWGKPYFSAQAMKIVFAETSVSIDYSLGKISSSVDNVEVIANDLVSYTICSSNHQALHAGQYIHPIYLKDDYVYIYVYIPNNPDFQVEDIILNSTTNLEFEKIIPDNYITHYKAYFANPKEAFNLEIITTNEVISEYDDEVDSNPNNFQFYIERDDSGTAYAQVYGYTGSSKNIEIPAKCKVDDVEYFIEEISLTHENNFVESITFNANFIPLPNGNNTILNWSALKKVDTSNISNIMFQLNLLNLSNLEIYSSYYSDICYKDSEIVSANFYVYRDLALYFTTLFSSGQKIYLSENFLTDIIEQGFEFVAEHNKNYVSYYYEGSQEEFISIISASHTSAEIEALLNTFSYNNYSTFNFNANPLTTEELLSARENIVETMTFNIEVNDETNSLIRIYDTRNAQEYITPCNDVLVNGHRYVIEIFTPYNSNYTIQLENAVLSLNGRVINDETMTPKSLLYVYFVDINENSTDLVLQINYPT